MFFLRRFIETVFKHFNSKMPGRLPVKVVLIGNTNLRLSFNLSGCLGIIFSKVYHAAFDLWIGRDQYI